MKLTVRFEPDQMKELASMIAAEMRGANMSGTKPLTVDEAAEALGLSKHTIYRQVKAGLIAKVPGTAKLLIPRAEIERLTTPKGGHVR